MSKITDFWNNHDVQRHIRCLKRNPLSHIGKQLDNLWYKTRCIFFPYNVIKIKNIDRTWIDRDSLMMHAMFQILVDFVELEQPFKEWGSKRKKRQTDYAEMVRFNEEHYNTDAARASFHMDRCTEEENKRVDITTANTYSKNAEVLYLYKWYKDDRYVFKFKYYYEATGSSIRQDFGILPVPSGAAPLITWQEFHETEEEHDLICGIMLKRILEVRGYLWT